MEEEEQQEQQQQEEAESVEHQYMCSECQQLFNTLEDVLLHQRIHTGAEADGEVEVVEGVLAEEQSQTYQCLECGALIVTSEDLLQHQEMHMREVEQPVLTEVLETQTGQPEAQLSAGVQYQCLDCLALFDSPDAWLAHRRIHSRSSTHSNTESVEYMIQPNGTLTPLNSTQNYLLSEQQAGEILAQVLAQQQRQEPKKSRPFSKAAAASRSALLPPVTPAPGSATMHLQILTAQVLADSSPPPGQQHAKMAQGPAAKPGALENGVQRLELRLAPGGVRELQQPAEVVVIHPYECSECSLLFQTPEDFLQHQGEHFLCQDKESAESGVMGGCEETRGREEILGRSEEFRGVENRESVWAKPQKCDLCTRTFNSVNRLAAHKRVHEQGTHECPECGKVFKKATSLQTHQRTHSGVARYLCVDCGHGFTTEMTLIMHRKSHTSDPLHKCQFCNKTFTNMTKYLYHRRIHLNRDAAGPPVVFTDSAPTRVSVSALAILQRARGRKDALEPFLRDQTERAEPERSDPTHDQGEVEKENMEASAPPEEEPKAPSPGKVSAQNPANVGATATATDCTVAPVMVQRRLKSQLTGERPFQCSDCGKTFSFLANLMRHNLIHSGVRPYRCDICHRAFSQSSNLRQHSLLHSRAATLRCPDCPSTFRWPTKLAAHRYTRHPGSPAPFTCPHCAAGFLSRRRRDAHCLERHLGQVRAAAGTEVTADPSTSTAAQGGEASVRGCLDCHICGKKLNSAANLRLHKLSHFASGPGRPRSGVAKQSQKCPICGKQFVSSSGVALHQRVHTGERPFPCQVCGKRFRQNTHLREHLRTHSGERPFRCEVCGKAFIQSMHLAEHRRTHTGERPHVCPLCGKAFKTFSNLRNHKKTHARQQRVDQEAEAAAAAAPAAAPPQDTMQTAATVTMEASAVEVSEGQPQIIQIQASDIQQCTPTIMCNEFGETIAIIEGGGLPLEQALEIYQRALENGLAVDTVAVEGLRLL